MVKKNGSAVIIENATGQSKMRNVGHMKKFTEPETEKNMTQAGTPTPSVSSQSAKESMLERNALPPAETTSSSPE